MSFLRATLFVAFLFILSVNALAQQAQKTASGNPVFPGWYADPEGTIFGKNYWIYPTFSAPYNQQVFFDAFSSPDLVNWTKLNRRKVGQTSHVGTGHCRKKWPVFSILWCQRHSR